MRATHPTHRYETKGKRVLLVDDDRQSLDLLSDSLSKDGQHITTAMDPDSVLHKIKAWRPHLLLLNNRMQGLPGLDLIPKIRASTPDDYLPIILLTPHMSVDDVVQGMEAGADDYLTKPFRAQELLARVRMMARVKEIQDSLRRANHRIEELATCDDVTGLLNIRTLYKRGDDEVQRCKKFHKPVSALLVNVDNFASINETAEFLFGTQVLREVGLRIKQCVRGPDLVGHLGADEYLVILPETDLAGAELAAQRIMGSLQTAEFRMDKHIAKVTACIGISGFSPIRVDGNMAELYRNANEALHLAKNNSAGSLEIYAFAK